MTFMPDEDAVQLGGYLRAYLAKEAPESELRSRMESEEAFDVRLWTRTAAELGVQGMAISSEYGGSEAGLTPLGVCFEELGRALVCAPFLSTVALAATALSQVPGGTAAELLADIAAGTGTACLAWSGNDPCDSDLEVAGGYLDGTAEIVVEGWAADNVLVAARDRQGVVGLYLTRTPFDGVTRTRLQPLDLTRRLARLDFERAPVEPLLLDARQVLARTRDVAWLLLAAEQLGGAQRVLDLAVDYAKERVQFGRAIGSFQAVKHRLADMLVQVELTRSVVYHALHRAESEPAALPADAALARAVASDAFLHCAGGSIQVHGGIGFTWEHSAHLYLKRAKSSSLLFGSSTNARRRLARELDLAEAVS
jgi:alkylation response protein AidB-like acyl-CoA dehydrogenase